MYGMRWHVCCKSINEVNRSSYNLIRVEVVILQVPLEIAFRDVERTDEIDELIRKEVEKLEKMHHNITSCRLAVERPHSAQQSGNPFRVRLGIRVPRGHEVVITRDPADNDMHDPLDVVLNNAFKSAQRKLRKLIEQQRNQTKKHPDQEAGAVVEKLFPEEGYGFLRTVDGEEVYFHRNSVIHNDFDRLEIGTGVRYVAETGDRGLQASTVQIVDKPGARPK